MDHSSPLTSPIAPPRGGVGTEWLKASLRHAFNRESQRRFTVFAGCGDAAASTSAGGISARSAGTPPVLFTTPMMLSATSDIGATSCGFTSHTSTASFVPELHTHEPVIHTNTDSRRAMRGHETHRHSPEVFGSQSEFQQQGDLCHQPAGPGPGERTTGSHPNQKTLHNS